MTEHMTTENEPTVPMPVSLAQRFLGANDAGLAASTIDRDELRTLLSQPTPTAEPCPECLYVEGHHDDCGRLDDYLSHRDPEPPRIEDMAPGATKCADPNVNRWYCQRGADGTCPLPKCADPSTIRDVTPPAVTE